MYNEFKYEPIDNNWPIFIYTMFIKKMETRSKKLFEL